MSIQCIPNTLGEETQPFGIVLNESRLPSTSSLLSTRDMPTRQSLICSFQPDNGRVPKDQDIKANEEATYAFLGFLRLLYDIKAFVQAFIQVSPSKIVDRHNYFLELAISRIGTSLSTLEARNRMKGLRRIRTLTFNIQ